MKIITYEDIKALQISPLDCYDWVVEALQHKEEALLPPKISLSKESGTFCNVMPSFIQHAEYGLLGGIKVVTRYPNREPSLDSKLLLLDAKTGEFLSLMEADWITTMRTGAVAAHSIELLAKKDFSTMGFLGLGNTARAALWVLAERLKGRELFIKLLRYKDQAEDFMKRFAEYPNLHFEIVDTMEELVRGSAVVVSAVTYFGADACPSSLFEPGTLLVPIHTRGFTECDLTFDKVFADDRGHVCHFGNFSKFKSFAEVADVISGKVKGRESDDERILAYNIGISLHDITFAGYIYTKYMKANAGNAEKLKDIDFAQPVEKFWI